MTPIFEEYCKFLKDKTGLELVEGYYWYDNGIIKAFDRFGVLLQLYKIDVSVDLQINIHIPKRYYSKDVPISELKSWGETIADFSEELDYFEKTSIELIVRQLEKRPNATPIVLNSGGKESSVISFLAQKAIPGTANIFCNTTTDCSDTYLFVKSIPNIQIVNPKEGFYPWVKRSGFIPTRHSRACCKKYKEEMMTSILERSKDYLFLLGMRNSESATRKNYGDIWENKLWPSNWKGILPIREWSELDVWLYILRENIPVNPKYKKGYTRAGCSVSCPFLTKNSWVLDEYWYPKMRQRWLEILRDSFVADGTATIMNCTLREYLSGAWQGGVVREHPTEEVVQEFMEHRRIEDKKVAEQYFGQKCDSCKKNLRKDEVGLNMKHQIPTGRFLCLKCMAKKMGVKQDVLRKEIIGFKEQECSLF